MLRALRAAAAAAPVWDLPETADGGRVRGHNVRVANSVNFSSSAEG
jgi:hypothetical protein